MVALRVNCAVRKSPTCSISGWISRLSAVCARAWSGGIMGVVIGCLEMRRVAAVERLTQSMETAAKAFLVGLSFSTWLGSCKSKNSNL